MFGDPAVVGLQLAAPTSAPVATTVPLSQAPISAALPVAPPPANVTPYTPAQVQAFQTQLEQYKTQLVALYDARSQMIASREQARFQYLQAWRFKLEFTLNAMANAASNPEQFISAVTSYFLTSISMSDINGNEVSPYNPSGTTIDAAWYMFSGASIIDINPLMPMNVILQSPNLSQCISEVASIKFSWPDGSGGISGVYANGIGATFPVPQNYVDAINAGVSAAIFATDYGQGSFNDLMTQGLALFQNMNSQTQGIIDNQVNIISPLEAEVSAFITQYQQYGMIDQSLGTSSILSQVNQLSAAQNAQNALQALTNPPTQGLSLQSLPTWSLYGGAAAILLFLLTRKKQ